MPKNRGCSVSDRYRADVARGESTGEHHRPVAELDDPLGDVRLDGLRGTADPAVGGERVEQEHINPCSLVRPDERAFDALAAPDVQHLHHCRVRTLRSSVP